MAAYQHKAWPTQVQPPRLAIRISISPSPRSVRELHKDFCEEFAGEFVDGERAVSQSSQFQTPTRYRFHDHLLFRVQFNKFLAYCFA